MSELQNDMAQGYNYKAPLLERLKYTAQAHLKHHPDYGSCALCTDLHEAIAALEQQQWVSVEDRLPEKQEDYYVYGGNPRHKVRCYYGPSKSFCDANVTHWKPITPPEEDRFPDITSLR